MSPVRIQRGVSLIELILFIVIVGVGVAGLLAVFNVTVRGSGDPLVRKQLLAIGEALLEEAALHPFTYCDPTDPHVLTATGAVLDAANTDGSKCKETVEGLGVVGGEALQDRYSVTRPFNNVNDYHGLAMDPIKDLQGTAVPLLTGYAASVSVTEKGTDFGLANDAAVRIEVSVVRGGESLTLTGYRFRFAPNVPG